MRRRNKFSAVCIVVESQLGTDSVGTRCHGRGDSVKGLSIVGVAVNNDIVP